MNEQEVIKIKPDLASLRMSSFLARAYLNKVYGWMALTMLITTAVAVYSTHSEMLNRLVIEHPVFTILTAVGIVVVMSFGRTRLSVATLGTLLILFSVVEGLLFGPVLQAYTQESLALTFACTAGTFGIMALYGACTKRDLSVLGRTLFMILFGLVICLVANIFWGNSTFDAILSVVGVILFSLLTAYDTQALLREGSTMHDEDGRAKGAILGALDLYLDFINLFLYLLRFLGDRR